MKPSTRQRLLDQALYKSGESFTAAEIGSRLAVSTSNAKYVCSAMVDDGELDRLPTGAEEPELFQKRSSFKKMIMSGVWR